MDALIKVGAMVAVAGVVAVAASSGGPRVAPAVPARAVPAYSQALNAQLAADAAQAGPMAPKAMVEAGGVRLRSVGFTFPSEGRAFPPGAGVELMAGNCVPCHTSGMILTQPPLTRAEWAGEVTKMVRVYKAPIDEADVPGIVGYLASLPAAR